MKFGRSRDRDTELVVVRVPVVTGLLAVVVVALAVAVAVLGSSVWRAEAREDQRAAAMQSARQTAVNLATIDHRNLPKSLERVASGLTGEAKDQWGTMSADISKAAQQGKSTATVRDMRAGVVSMDEDSAEVIVAVTSVVTSAEVPNGQQRYFRWRFDLTRTDGRWLVSNMRLVA
ncbi:hypothetical protein [Thermomonospora amylolytica]|uniref:hypothetical protein n=1 Tax=Thermomonospora amylolytica TaxID=1411117 RepID=UPI001300276A|nr:hypothetical protein [Thermomonospora amylolytica]